VLQEAEAMLGVLGEDGLQMKDLATRAGLALATMYRYFPSKDHIILAIAKSRYERALKYVRSQPLIGSTPGERVANLLLRQFRAEQREPQITAATARVMHDTDRTFSELLERVASVRHEILRFVAQGDGPPLSAVMDRTLVVVGSAFGTATLNWLSGVRSAAEARFEIRLSCLLLDLPEAMLEAQLEQALADASVGDAAVSISGS
jgi:AcrR family transcriptional regulator